MDELPPQDSAHVEIATDFANDAGEAFESDPFSSLKELAEWIESDDGDTLNNAINGLASVEPETRVRILEGLGDLPASLGLLALFRAFSDASDDETRAAARRALGWNPSSSRAKVSAEVEVYPRPVADGLPGPSDSWELSEPNGKVDSIALSVVVDEDQNPVGDVEDGRRLPVPIASGLRRVPLISLDRSLVTAVDGHGNATIAVASTRDGVARSAVFRCNVLNGVHGVLGRVEEEPIDAGLRIDSVIASLPEGSSRLENVDDLATSLLAGVLSLGSRGAEPNSTALEARSWIREILGSELRPQPIPIPTFADTHTLGRTGTATTREELPRIAQEVLDACPAWTDTSPLTLELAEEIELREGSRRKTNPNRHAGAYRYLFEHTLIERLELYQRMLLWMAWFWRFSGKWSLSDSAVSIALELSDEQYAVPSHPFTVALTTRSLDNARSLLRARSRNR